MRAYINIINENYTTTDPVLYDRIEKAIVALPTMEERQMVQDALEVICQAGPTGITSNAWARKMKDMHPSMGKDEMVLVMRAVVSHFKFCVSRTNREDETIVYQWVAPMQAGEEEPVAEPTPEPLDMNDPLTAAAHMQITLTSHVFDIMKAMGRFDPDDVAAQVAEQTGAELPIARMIVQHVIDQLRSQIKFNPEDGTYTHEEPRQDTVADHLAKFRSMLDVAPPKHDAP